MMLKPSIFVTIAFAAFCLMLSPSAKAQNVYAAIHGTVTDTSGAVVPNAAVTVVNTSTNITTTAKSDSKGYYILPQLQIGGPYTVTVSATGFNSFTQSGLTLQLNDNRDVDARLEVGSNNTTVNVSASAVQVETSDTQIKQVMTSEQMEDIPLEGRDPTGLQKLEPGVVESSDRFGTYSTDGSQSPQNAYLLNGVDISQSELQAQAIQVNPDALQEENVIASTLNPEFSRNSGATVNQIVKAGTNQFHGDAFEFYRDTFMNSKPFFATTVPQFHQNLYGATLGGPVIRDRLFFFLGYQGSRSVAGAPTEEPTLSGADFLGNFSGDTNFATGGLNTVTGLTSNPIPFAIGGCAAGTAWNACFPTGNVSVAPGNWNPIALNTTTKYIPQPNAGNFYAFNTDDPVASDQGIIRADYTPTSRDSIWASSVFQSTPFSDTLSFGGGDFPGFGTNNAEHFKLFSASYTHTFNANTLNELRAGFFRFNFASGEPANPAPPSSYGFTGITPQDSSAPSFPFTIIGSFAVGFSFEAPQPSISTNATYADNFTKIIGAHTLKLGASYEQLRVDNPFDAFNNGRFVFDGAGLYSSGDPNLDFELGIPDSYVQASDGFVNELATETYAYAQDSWKISPDITANYGIAWDVEAPNRNNQYSHLGIVCWNNSTAESTVFPGGPPGLAFPGDPNCNNAGGPTPHYNRFGPRIGIAWSPSSGPAFLIGQPGSHDFSIRAGYGIYYNRDQEEQSLQNLEDPPFFFVSHGAGDFGGSPGFANPFVDVAGNGSEPNPFPFTIPTPGDTNIQWESQYSLEELATFDRKLYTVPYAQNFNLNIQRSLPSSMILQIGYVGSLGHRLATWYDGDNITAAGHAACAAGATVTLGGTAFPCNGPALRGSVRTYFPQFTADPAIVPGTGGGAISSFPNGVPWYVSIAQQITEGSSNYNSLQVSLIKARTHGLYATFAYTYSHALDNSSGYESSTGQGGQNFPLSGHNYIYTPGFQYLNYGDSDYDARQRFVTSYIYEIPIFSSIANNAILRNSIAGWELGGVTALQSGYPISFSEGLDQSLYCDGDSFFGCGDTPDTSSFHLQRLNPRKVNTFTVNGVPETGHFFFNPEPFSPEPVGTFGNVKRNFFHGPGFNYTNLQLSKNFRIFPNNESRYLQLRVEAFNAFNHANFLTPDSIFSNANTFGQVSSVLVSAEANGDPSPARSFQLVGKFYF
jgi:hypothetical protein